MNLIKLIPYATREAIRKALFGKNHFHDLAAFASRIGCRVAFDVGAQKGYESILFAKSGMTVWAFEPNDITRKEMYKNLKYESRGKGGEVMVTPFAASNFCEPKNKITTIRAFLEIGGLIGVRSPDLVKIDTDGDDMRVLAGFPFDTCRPALFSVEWDEAGEVARKLDAEGYRIVYAIYKPVNRWKRAIFSRYSLTPDFRGGEWGDVVGVRPEHFEKYKQLTGISG